MANVSDFSAGRAIIELPWSCPPLSLNQRGASRGAAFVHAKKVAEVRAEVYQLARAQRLPRGLAHITVQLHYRPRDRRRRDTDNLIATAKPMYDALTDGRPAKISKRSGKIVPPQVGYGMVADDTPEFMAKPEPIITPSVKGLPGAMWLEITWVAAVASELSVEPIEAPAEVLPSQPVDESASPVAGIETDREPRALCEPSNARDFFPAGQEPAPGVSLQPSAIAPDPGVSLQVPRSESEEKSAPVLQDTTCCAVCGTQITQPGTGRPRKTCSGACRVRAARDRKKVAADGKKVVRVVA